MTRSETWATVGSIEQNELIAQIRKAQASAAVIQTEQGPLTTYN